MSTIKAIQPSTVHQIQSGQVIVDLCSVVKELLENSLDAGATTIDVRFKNQGLDSIEVQDNGPGISSENYASLALKHHTSKLETFSDLATIQTFGFRGEALSSLCALSHLTVVTCLASDVPKGTRLDFEPSGQLKGTSVVATEKGTTVSINDLFRSLPVRRRELERNIKREWTKVIALLNQYACIQTGLKLTVSQQPSKGKRILLFSTKGNPTTRENIINIFGAKAMAVLIRLDVKLEFEPTASHTQESLSGANDQISTRARVQGFVSRPAHGDGRQTPDRQMFFVNSRPCILPQFARIFNEVYRSYNSSQSPFIFANIEMDTHLYDVNVSPDKRTILLHEQARLLDSLRQSLLSLFESHDYSIPISSIDPARSLSSRAHEPAVEAVSESVDSHPMGNRQDEERQRNQSTAPTKVSFNDKLRRNGDSESPMTLSRDQDAQNLMSRWVQKKPIGQDEKEQPRARDPERNEESASSPAASTDASSSPYSEHETVTPSRLANSAATPAAVHDARLRLTHGSIPKVLPSRSPAEFQTDRRTGGNKLEDPAPSFPVHLISDRSHDIHDNHESALEVRSFPREDSPAESEESYQRQAPTSSTKTALSRRLRQNRCAESAPMVPCAFSNSREGSPGSVKVGSAQESFDQEVSELRQDGDDHGASASSLRPRRYEDLGLQSISDDNRRTLRALPEANEDGENQDIMMGQGDRLKRLQGRRKETNIHRLQILKTDEAEILAQVKLGDYGSKPVRQPPQPTEIKGGPDAKDAEETLSLVISKTDFANMQVVGQFNLGFVLAVRRGDEQHSSKASTGDHLFIIDQHASDEKYNFERLQTTTTVQSQNLVRPKRLELTGLEEEIVRENLAALEVNGFKVQIDETDAYTVGSRCQLTALPLSRETTFTTKDLEELIALLGDDYCAGVETTPRPSKVRKMFAMRACRSSIMIGKALTHQQMSKLVRHMGELDKPWNCPHGRPTMRHLCQLDFWDLRLWDEPSWDGNSDEIDWSRYATSND